MNDANEQHHSIKEMIFDVQLNSENEAFRFQRGFSDLVKAKLLAITEKVFNELAPIDQLVKIRSLTVDLETIELQRFEHDIPDLYEKRLRETLRSLLFRLKGITYSAVDDASVTSPEIGLSQLLSFFLRTGTIPWWAKSTWQAYLKQQRFGSEPTFTIGLLFETVFERNPELFSQLIERYQTEPLLLYRLADQVPDKQLLQVIRAISPEKAAVYERIIQDIAKVSTPRLLTLQHSQARVLTWQIFFLNWDQNNEIALVEMVVEKFFSIIRQQVSETAQYLLKLNLDKHQLQTTLGSSLRRFTGETAGEVLFTSDTKTLQLLQQIVSEQEARLLQAFVRRLLEVAPNLLIKEVWDFTLDYLSENRGQTLNLRNLVSEVLPQLTSEWREVAQKLQIELDHNLFIVEEFDQASFNQVIESKAANVIHFLRQILEPTQAAWAERYGSLLAQALNKSITSVWEVLLEIFWENRKKAFSRERFLKTSFPRVWKKLVKVIPIRSDIPALKDQKMWETTPLEVIARLSEEVVGFKEINSNFWEKELNAPQEASSTLTSSQQELEETRLNERKKRFNQAFNDGKIREFIEQILPGQAIWLEQYVDALYRIIGLDRLVIWELILEELWAKRSDTGSFNQRSFMLGSFSRIIQHISPTGTSPASDPSTSPPSSSGTYSEEKTRVNVRRWQQVKTWIEQLAQSFPSFAQIQEEARIARYYEGVSLKREELIAQPVTQDIKEVIERLFTKGILPASAQIQRQLGMFLRRPLVSMEETITNLIDIALTQTGFSLSQLLEPVVLQRLMEQTSPAFVQALLEQLKTIDTSLAIPDLTTIEQLLQRDPKEEDPNSVKGPDSAKDLSTKDDLDTLVYYLQHFLQSGTLPVSARTSIDFGTSSETSTSDTADTSTDTRNAYIKQWLYDLRNQYPEDFQQFILALSATDIDVLISAVPEVSEWVQEVWQKVTEDYRSTLESNKEAEAQADIEQGKRTGDKSSEVGQGQSQTQEGDLQGEREEDRQKRIQQAEDRKRRGEADKLDEDTSRKQTEEEERSRQEKEQQRKQQQTEEEKERERLERETFERIKAEILQSTKAPKQQLTDQVLYVENAGLVILHPYLLRLFDMLKLTQSTTTQRPSKKNPQKMVKKTEVTFKGDPERERAVYVLQYLASKNEEAEEHELALNKVLCGMEITSPFVSGKITLTDEEKETCEGLLAAVVQNWSILKDSPADMLRGSFFMREGRLEMKNAEWHLKVEETGIDVLLQHLPWSIGVVKLPWMENVLNVEWM
ncbi:MAG TPA: hypothetical protein DCS93_42610 [Microscillaceae bacterium]|nr:hypothetical protein [Microscillaceae bacterium]